MAEPLLMWTIYDHPLDYPGVDFVVREWAITAEGQEGGRVYAAESLAYARLHVPPGLHCHPRDPSDDEVIVETWY